MLYNMDKDNKPGTAVRTLLYTDETELTGNILTLADGTVVHCAVGSIAMKLGMDEMKQLGPEGWV